MTNATGFDALIDWALEYMDRSTDPALVPTVRARALDYAANVAGGSARPAVRLLSEHAAITEAGLPLPGGGRATLDRAALPWGAAAHVLECDDTHQPSSSHPGAVIFTTALLLAATRGESLETVARAAVVGYEVMCRLGAATGPTSEYARGFHPTGTCGTFGAAAAACAVLEASRETLRSALGIAGSFSSGSMSFLTSGAWTKILHPGHAATDGITAAQLAAKGYRGPEDPLSPPHGYFAGHAESGTPAVLSAPEPGEALAIERTSVKAHACCRYEQGPIDALLELRERLGLDSADIARIDVGVLRAGWNLIAEPIGAKRRPSSPVDAQFSMPYGAALAVVRGVAGPIDHEAESIGDPELIRVAELVHCRIEPELEAQYPQKWPASAEITLRDGSTHRADVDYPKGDPENPHSLVELSERVGQLAPWADPASVDAVVEILNPDELADHSARELVDCISSCCASREMA